LESALKKRQKLQENFVFFFSFTSERVKLGKVKEVISRAAKQDSSSPIKAHDIKHLGIRGYGNLPRKQKS
jgi:hypothetical protein